MKKIIILFLITLLAFSTTAQAELITRETADNIYILQSTVTELEEFFSKHNYQRFNLLDKDAFPKIYLTTFPTDYQDIPSQKKRNELFIRILAPIALKINEELTNERKKLLRIERKHMQKGTLTEQENEQLEILALKYDCFTRSQGPARINEFIEKLKLRLNIIPPSILIAISAMETNWGSSRVVNKANSLYKEKVWYTDEGLEPLENKDDGYRFKIFSDITDSMRSFARTFNSDKKFYHVWVARDMAIKRHGKAIGETLAYTLSTASNLPNYAGILDYISTFYNLYSIDIGHLENLTTE